MVVVKHWEIAGLQWILEVRFSADVEKVNGEQCGGDSWVETGSESERVHFGDLEM